MDGTKIKLLEKMPKLNNPIFIEGLPGVGNIGRIAVGYLLEELKAKKFAELFSSHFMPFVLVHQSSAVHVLKNEFYYWKSDKPKGRDIIFLIGDSQSVDPIGHYEIVETILDFIEQLGVKDIITTAGLSVQNRGVSENLIGVVTDPKVIQKYKNQGIDFDAGSKVGTIIGASGLLLGLGRYRGMGGMCLLGQTAVVPEIPDPKTAEVVLKTLIKILNVKIDLSELKDKIKEMESFMKKIQKVQTKALSQMLAEEMKEPKASKEDLKYIG
ncbi:MAG: proteasome assembly chaperone family protein [Candidatus Aenigmarchaeota archaeon]|nr:proteasome assembly chaperone family protein [Candidatus Aenigmarchaeota archaeon]PJB75389.1 MAG: proteasome assembly chaperone family protein [Candidatus Aenigmarchaeota archaeon CG_4_9_14_3_um_filter_37_18]